MNNKLTEKQLNILSEDTHDEDELEEELEEDSDFINDDDDDSDIEVKIVTDISIIKNKINKPKLKTKKTKFVGKHTLAYDTIHNSKRETIEDFEEEYIIHDLNNNFSVNYNIDTEQNYNSDEYHFSIELKNKVLNLLIEHTDIDFSPETKRRIPSVNDLNAYYKLLITELCDYRYSQTEIFTTLSEFFTDNIWNVYKKLNNKYKSVIFTELKEKYKIADIEKIDFL